MLRKIRSLYSSKIEIRILLFFFTLFFLVIVLVFLPWNLYLRHQSQQDTKKLVTQQLASLDNNMVMSLENRSAIVDMLLVNKQFENATQAGSKELSSQRVVQDTLTRILISDLELISAAYFYDNGGSFVATSQHLYELHPEVLQSREWEERLDKADNAMTYVYCGGDAITMTKHAEPFISLTRTVNSITDFKRLGVVMLNMTTRKVGETMTNQLGENSYAVLYNTQLEELASTEASEVSVTDLVQEFKNPGENTVVIRRGGQRFLLARFPSQIGDLSYISITPLTSSLGATSTIAIIIFITTLTATLVISQLYIRRTLSQPLAEMCVYMHMAEQEQFDPIPIADKEATDEITQLKLFFNRMIMAIDALVERIMEKERLKKEHEIALLQEQIKPHFLYNALDAISALSLIGDNETAYTLTTAMSSFYRATISGGYHIIPFSSELESIQNYIIVLNIRHQNLIDFRYSMEEGVADVKVLKLILQPVVENAIYHGIRKKRGASLLEIRAVWNKDKSGIIVSVEDDGAGMSQKRIEEVLAGKSRETGKGFGLYNLAEKLELFYKTPKALRIESQPGKGTIVTLHLAEIDDKQESGIEIA